MPVRPVRPPVPLLVLAAVVVAVLAACDAAGATPGDTPEPTPAPGLEGSSWTVVSIGDAPTVDGGRPTIAFEPGRVSGSTGCNQFNGSYTIDGASLVFEPLATTRRACEAPLMEQESALVAALGSVTGWSIADDGRLHLTGEDELVLEPAAP